ncbi:3-keto-5-aminohexanoate cleavage protein [Micromonospora sp. MH99]|uniref:3-keto-5-aminohexanoate cleavage protein n=1 Tax=Micromonospora sp. MH99 TaxID=1945510 RepID=UPI001F468BB6|nr:3-keto-5-aminohexanoate cleavage protein [Micromonospora sp. MH99]MCF0097081.1 3-keto-5-aminohexanoate cleavage enzyme [Micromonospora sp. MH99]
MVKACLNGQRSRAAHPAVPVTPAELAADAARCAALGVAAVHVHPRDAAGVESLHPTVIADALTAIRAARPGLPVGVSTGAWIEPDPAARVAAVRSWSVLPDFASVNAHEPGAEAVAIALHERGVLVEVGLWTVDAVQAYRSWRVPVGRILVECMAQEASVAVADAARILAALPPPAGAPGGSLSTGMPGGSLSAGAPGGSRAEDAGAPPVLLHGEGPATWAVLAEAVSRGLHTRIGLEDTLLLPDGVPASGNAALVTAALAAGAS